MNVKLINCLLKKKLLNTRITEFKLCTKVHCQMDIVLFTGRVQMMLYKTEELPPGDLRHYKDIDKTIVSLDNFTCVNN